MNLISSAKRQVVLDTETTGLEPKEGHRIIEIGCVEMIKRRPTGRHFHVYIQPDRVIDDGAIEVHGITNEFLADKPRFAEIVDEFIEFITGAELVIHNAAFDVGFMDHEFGMLNKGKTADFSTVLDTLLLARELHPGQKNNLDALTRRYEITHFERDLHGALLDSQILAEVYLAMTGGQATLDLSGEDDMGDDGQVGGFNIRRLKDDRPKLAIVRASEEELAAHADHLTMVDKRSGGACVWYQNDGLKTGDDA